jgi:N-acetylglucosamine kinase-like BadF-type ATPase
MYYLGVDGGGTKTAFMLINGNGEICAYNTKGTCHYHQVGVEGFHSVLSSGVSDLLQEASIALSEIQYSFFGLPGYGELIKSVPMLEDIVADVLKSTGFRCGNDVEAGWAGSLACQAGINLVGGTGAIGFGKDHSGNTARASGWGHFCGDEGSAYWLGKRLISVFAKQSDGREEKTQLYEIVRDRFRLERDFDLIDIVYEELRMQREEIAGLAVLLYEAAERGDPKAREAYREAAYEYSLIVKALVAGLSFDLEREILVSYSGGVFKAGEYILNPLREFLAKDRCKLIEPVLEPITGAALYAFLSSGKPKGKPIVEKLRIEEQRVLG